MGQKQSKDESVYERAGYGHVEEIKALCEEGAGTEYVDQEGKTPLIVACMTADGYNVAKTLIELGANVNAYRRGRDWGTPLHHAAKRRLENTVELLLSNGASPLVINDGGQTPLDVARAKGYNNVVRIIEGHMALFSGWLRELYGPTCPLTSRRVWVVICPCGSQEPAMPFKLELAIYPSMQDAQPRAIVALWGANLEEPNFYSSDYSVTIVNNTSRTRYKFGPANEGDQQQLQRFCDACKGNLQAMQVQPAFLRPVHPPVQPTAPPAEEDQELAMAINASIESAMQELPPPVGTNLPPVGSSGSKDGSEETCCVVCLDAPVQGACVPCGHMAGCMSCLKKIKAKKSGCPTCRTKIDQVIKLYAV